MLTSDFKKQINHVTAYTGVKTFLIAFIKRHNNLCDVSPLDSVLLIDSDRWKSTKRTIYLSYDN